MKSEISVANARIYLQNWATLKSSTVGIKKKKKKKKKKKNTCWAGDLYYWASLKSLAAGKKVNLPP